MAVSLTIGQRAADIAAAGFGSWRFIILLNSGVAIWCGLNWVLHRPFDPYPFILLNLIFSWFAGNQAPIIMISQRRQEELSRQQQRHMLTLQEAIYVHLLEKSPKAVAGTDEGLEDLNDATFNA